MEKYYRQVYKSLMERKPVVAPIYPYMLSYEDKSKAIEAVNLIKEGKNRKIKGNKFADNINKKSYLKEG